MLEKAGMYVQRDIYGEDADALVVVSLNDKTTFSDKRFVPFAASIHEQQQFNAEFSKEGGLILLPNQPFKRFVYAPVGPVNRDHDDIRNFCDSAVMGVSRAMKAGARNVIVQLPDPSDVPNEYPEYDLAIVLAVHQSLYSPLENRESHKIRKLDVISFSGFKSEARKQEVLGRALAIEDGRAVARDIGGSDPERMSAPKTADYCRKLFKNSNIQMEIIDDIEFIEREFPCLAAVNRASVERHQARVIFLTYEPEGPCEESLFLVGKGVTYDTGGADIKSGGIMAGMHRDKCGAAAVAGFFETVSQLKPKNIRIYGAMAMVRNSIGPNGYVADELIVSRAGVKVRVGNTDAEGRMAMVDLVTYYKEKIVRENIPNPQIFTIATLTGHCCMAVGFNYSIVLDNGPARKIQTAQKLTGAGDRVGDLFEISTIRKEDFKFNKGKSEYEDILQCNNSPSSRTPRGHQIPAAFLIQVSRLDQHGIDSEKPIAFSHIDIAGSSGPFPGVPTGAPVAALVERYLK